MIKYTHKPGVLLAFVENKRTVVYCLDTIKAINELMFAFRHFGIYSLDMPSNILLKIYDCLDNGCVTVKGPRSLLERDYRYPQWSPRLLLGIKNFPDNYSAITELVSKYGEEVIH